MMALGHAIPLVNLAASSNLALQDLWRLRRSESSEIAWDTFLPHWESQCRKTKYVQDYNLPEGLESFKPTFPVC